MNTSNLQSLRCWLGAISLLTVLAGCSVIGPKKEERAGASVRALNYTAREIYMIGVEEPGNPKNDGGGDALNPYSGGGSICCFGIPSQWHPDLKVIVEYQFYPEKEVRRALVNVPPYPDGKPGDIWLIVHEDESPEAVVSKYGPSRPEWPGKIKGYPVPSREYRLKLWGEKLQREKSSKAGFERALQRTDITPEQRAGYIDAIDYHNRVIIRLEENKP